MNRDFRAVCLWLAVSVTTGEAAATEVFLESALRLDASITSVASCATSAGEYRVVVFTRGFEHVSSEVYLQWLESDEGTSRVRASVVVAELSAGFWSAGVPVVRSRETCAFEVPATHTYNLEAARFFITPTDAGRYTFRRSTRK